MIRKIKNQRENKKKHQLKRDNHAANRYQLQAARNPYCIAHPPGLVLLRRRRVSLDGRSRRARSTPLVLKFFPRRASLPSPPLHLILTEHRPPALFRSAIAIRTAIIAVIEV